MLRENYILGHSTTRYDYDIRIVGKARERRDWERDVADELAYRNASA
jgi:hypothetical protein